jgi:uncharacterized glyoxalase superfamily protein PhnB/uncharacterized protein YndB with AHSA1/START domain
MNEMIRPANGMAGTKADSKAMQKAARHGVHVLSPHLVCHDATKAIDFYKQVFGAREMVRLDADNGKIIHACIGINGSSVMLVDEVKEMGMFSPLSLGGTPISVHLVVDDVDEVMARAEKAGAKIIMPVADMFWGDRFGMIEDPFGHHWSMGMPVKDMTEEELKAAAKAAMPKETSGQKPQEGCGPPTATRARHEAESAERELSFTRILNAPRAALWRCWTEPELVTQWFTPKPWETTSAKLDVRTGGSSIVTMRSPNGEEMTHPGVYLEVVLGEKLVFTDAFVRAWDPSTKPFMVASVTFEDAGQGKTKYTARALHWTKADTEAHRQMGFYAGWGKATDQLEELAQSL